MAAGPASAEVNELTQHDQPLRQSDVAFLQLIEVNARGDAPTCAIDSLPDRLMAARRPVPTNRFPSNRALWRPDARRIRWARAGTDGRWNITGLPAGDYLIAALVDLDPDDLADSAFLERMLAAAIKTSLGEGEQKTQDLRVGGS